MGRKSRLKAIRKIQTSFSFSDVFCEELNDLVEKYEDDDQVRELMQVAIGAWNRVAMNMDISFSDVFDPETGLEPGDVAEAMRRISDLKRSQYNHLTFMPIMANVNRADGCRGIEIMSIKGK